MPWTVVDYPVLRLTSTTSTANAGTVTALGPEVPVGYAWRVERIGTVINNGTGQLATLTVYDAPPTATTPPVTLTRVPNLNAAELDPPITILGGGQLVLVFAGVDVGVAAYARIQYELMHGVAPAPQPIGVA